MERSKSKFKYLLSTAALAGMLLAQSGNALVAHADQVQLKPGDTLSALAPRFKTTVNDLASRNHIANPNKIIAGQTIDTGNQAQSTDSATKIVVVKAGDTVSSLAKQYNTTIKQIAKDNGLDANYTIIVGQQLKINPDDGQNNDTGSLPAANNVQSAATSTTTSNSATAKQTTTSAQTASVNNNNSYSSPVSGNEAAAKAWIAGRESGGNYNARNGQYIGKYQLSSAYLGGDYSPAHQEQVADQYVQGRYGSWTAAQQFWQANGWY